MKNKNVIIAVVVLVILIGGYFAFFGKKTSSNKSQITATPGAQEQTQQEAIPTIAPEDIGLSLASTFNNKKVLIRITKTKDISAIDYQLAYVSKGNVPRGIIGQFTIANGKPISQEIVLGTCSDVCHYDEGVTSVDLTLKIVKADGKTYQLEKSLAF